MKGAARYKKNQTIPTIRLVNCPACKKDRLGRYVNEDNTTPPVQTTTVEVRGEERYLDVCGFCAERYSQTDQKFVMDNMRKLAQAFKNPTVDEESSDHKDFSLN